MTKVRRRRLLLAGLGLVAVVAVVWFAYARTRSNWRDDLDPEPEASAPALRPVPVLEYVDAAKSPDDRIEDPSFALFGPEYLWLAGRDELTRVSLDGGLITAYPIPEGIAPGSLVVDGDRVVWVDLGTPVAPHPANLRAASRSFLRDPVSLADLGRRWWWTGPQRPLVVNGYVVVLGARLNELDMPESSLAVVPVDGGAPRFVDLDTPLFCNEVGYASLTGSSDAVIVACTQQDPTSAVYEIAIPSLEQRTVRAQRRLKGWHPDRAIRVDSSLIVVGGLESSWGLHVKRLDARARLRSLVRVVSPSQTFSVLRGDGHEGYLYCIEGACADGRLFWFGPERWAELASPPRAAMQVDFNGGVLQWQQRDGDRVVLSINGSWSKAPLHADAVREGGTLYGVTHVRWQ